MQIHVIRSQDTLWSLAQAYNTTVQDIQQANQIPDPNRLVVGQAIVIPIEGSYYWVRSGDTLWQIARKYNLNYLELARLNQISPYNVLRVGTRLYIPPAPKTRAEVNAYIELSQDQLSATLLQSAIEVAPLLTYLAPFSYRVQSDGTLSDLPIDGLVTAIEQYNTTFMMVITNLSQGEFSGELAREILSNEQVQDTLIENIVQKAKQVGVYSDVHFDFEFIPADLKEAYTSFLKKATERLHQEQLLVSVALAPKTSSTQVGQWYEAHDYAQIGAIVDFVVIMTYEWGFSAGPPMPVSPIGPVEQVLQYALSQMPAYKIMMGQNLYGYDWTLPFTAGTYARAVSPQQAIQLALDHNVAISYDYQAQAPYFYYFDSQNRQHIVWFEDARSIQAKLDLMKKLGLRGISYWQLAFNFPQNWLLVEENINVIKH